MTSYSTKVVNGKVVPVTSSDVAYLEARDTAWQADVQHRAQQAARAGNLKNDPQVRAVSATLATSNEEIDAWFAQNVTTPEQTIDTLKTVCKILALLPLPR